MLSGTHVRLHVYDVYARGQASTMSRVYDVCVCMCVTLCLTHIVWVGSVSVCVCVSLCASRCVRVSLCAPRCVSLFANVSVPRTFSGGNVAACRRLPARRCCLAFEARKIMKNDL